MKGFPTLTLKRIQKRHAENPQDKDLHEQIENAQINRGNFKSLIEHSTKREPFDKEKS